jgi:hypothetical protein
MTQLGRADLDDRFEVLSVLGRGSFGVVYEVRDRRTGAPFALKLLTGQGELGRTQRELETSLRIDHPHVVRCHAGALTEDGGYLLLEMCEGSLAEVLADRTRRPLAWNYLTQTAEGLAALHAQGLAHRDLKPSNVLLRGDVAKVGDLGLVRGEDLGTMTEEGMVLGTPAFMAPEQARGERVGPACDVFALGVMLYEVVEGHLPYPDEGPMKRLVRVARAELFPLRRAREELPAASLELLEAMLSPDPRARPRDLAAAARTLRAHPPHGQERPGEESVAAPRLTQSSPRPRRLASTAPRGLRSPRRAARRSAWPLAFGAVVFATVLGFLWPEAPGKPPSTAAPDTGPFPPDYVRRLEDELQWAAHQVMGADGSLRESSKKSLAEGEQDLLTWDPHGWFPAMAHLPEVQRFHTWIAGGGQVDELSPELREALRAIDEAYVRRRFRRVFFPQLYLEPSPGSGPVPGYPLDWDPEGMATPDPWRRATVEHIVHNMEAQTRLELQLAAAGRGEPSEAPEVLGEVFRSVSIVPELLDRRALLPMMSGPWRETRNRARLGAWLAPLSDSLELALATAVRGLKAPGARKWAYRVVITPWPTYDLGDLGPATWAPEQTILGNVPDTPPGNFLRAHFIRRQIHGREILGHSVVELRRRRAALLERVLTGLGEEEPDHLHWTALRLALHEYVHVLDAREFRRLFMEYVPKLAAKPAPTWGGYHHAIYHTTRRLPDPIPLRRSELQAIRDQLTSRGKLPPTYDSVLERLDLVIARAPEELAPEFATP